MRRTQLLIGFMCAALLVYFVVLGRTGIALIRTGGPTAIALGVGVLILPLVGAWAMVATLRAGFAHQRHHKHAHGLVADLLGFGIGAVHVIERCLHPAVDGLGACRAHRIVARRHQGTRAHKQPAPRHLYHRNASCFAALPGLPALGATISCSGASVTAPWAQRAIKAAARGAK